MSTRVLRKLWTLIRTPEILGGRGEDKPPSPEAEKSTLIFAAASHPFNMEFKGHNETSAVRTSFSSGELESET